MKSRIMYIENKSESLSGPARIEHVNFSKIGKTIYDRGRKPQSLRGAGFKANYYDLESRDEYWISGPKKNGEDRLYNERVPVKIDDDAREEYWTKIRDLPARKDEYLA